MNMTSGATFSGWNRNKLNVILVLCVVTLSLSVAIALAGNDIWSSNGSSEAGGITQTSERAVGPNGYNSAEDWGLVAEAYVRPQASSSFEANEFLGLGQPGEAVRSNEIAPVIDPEDLGSSGAESQVGAVQSQFSTAADAVFAAEALDHSLPTTFAADYLGIGQPGESVRSSDVAPLIDTQDFGSIGAEYLARAAQAQFSTAADAVFAAEALDYSLPTTFAADYLGIGQPGEGVAARDWPVLIDEDDFGAYAAEMDFYTQPAGVAVPSDGVLTDDSLPTTFAAELSIGTAEEPITMSGDDFLGIGQPGEGSVVADPMLGAVVGPDQVYVIEPEVWWP